MIRDKPYNRRSIDGCSLRVSFSKNGGDLATLASLMAFIGFIVFSGCANPVAPTGGAKDTTPPQLDTLHSTRNRQVRFEKQPVILAFDEWVELRDAFNQVVISPPLEYRPKIERRKKTIQFRFDDREILRDSATYVINFGEAIRDLTEGNTAPVVFVFSTGDYIDSLSVEGEIVDAFTGEPVENVLFMLYENLADSVVRTERPFYFARTDKTGKFKVENIKSGTFKAFALDDQNLNYRFDNEAERVGFLDSAIVLGGRDGMLSDALQLEPDTTGIDTSVVVQQDSAFVSPTDKGAPSIRMRLFQEQQTLYLRDEELDEYGLIKLFFNREPHDIELDYDDIGQFTYVEQVKDTILLWYAAETDVPWNLYVSRDTITDTLNIESGLKEAFYENAKLKPAVKPPSSPPTIPPSVQYNFLFNHPLFDFDTSGIRILEDSIGRSVPFEVMIDSTKQRGLLFSISRKPGAIYKMQLNPGSVTDIFGLSNTDTIRRSFKAGAPKDFGSLTLEVTGLDTSMAYVISLVDKDQKEIRSYQVWGDTVLRKKLDLMPPGIYTIQIIEDIDRNGRWTTGDYDLRRHPERLQRRQLEELRANWEVDANIEWQPGQIIKTNSGGAGNNNRPASNGRE